MWHDNLMEQLELHVRRRTFNSLALGIASALGTRADGKLDKRAQFVRDLSGGYEQQLVGVDLADVDLIFRNMRDPVLGTGFGVGASRAVDAAVDALRDAGRLGNHAIVTIAFPRKHWRLLEFKAAMTTARAQLDSGTGLQIYVLCADDRIENGVVRVSVLTG